MKLGIVSAFPPSKVTLNEYAHHLVLNFRNHQSVSEIIVFTNITEDEVTSNYSVEDCKVTFVSCWKFNSYFNLLSIRKAIRLHQPDMVLYNLQFMKFGDKKIPAALGLFSPWLTRKMRIPTITLLHNIMETVDLNSAGFTSSPIKASFYNAIGTQLTSIILRSDLVTVTIENYVDQLEQKYFASNVKLIPHGTFEIPEEPNYELSGDTKQILAFGKFGTYKKVERLIEAVVEVRERTKERLEIVIAGTDNPNTIGYLDTVAQKFSHVEDLRFTGYVEEEDVPRIFSESTIVAFPYTSTTGSSGVLHQAASYGKAVVLPNIGDLASLIEDEGYSAGFFDPHSTSSLADAIEEFITNDNLRKSVAKNNYQAATAIPMNHVTDLYMEAFQDIFKKRNITSWNLV